MRCPDFFVTICNTINNKCDIILPYLTGEQSGLSPDWVCIMRIVTISREFGSGGRELGKRLSEALNCDYYDKEIIATIAERCKVDEEYAEYLLTHSFPSTANITMRNSFHIASTLQMTQIHFLCEQSKVIKEIAKTGRDCVIVGRNADLLLEDYCPFNIFVCADLETKLQRCHDRASKGEVMTDKEMIKKCKQIDKNRKKTRAMISDLPWGDKQTYNLIVNTSGWKIKDLVPLVAQFVDKWFEEE